jgi:hypothetical protein
MTRRMKYLLAAGALLLSVAAGIASGQSSAGLANAEKGNGTPMAGFNTEKQEIEPTLLAGFNSKKQGTGIVY